MTKKGQEPAFPGFRESHTMNTRLDTPGMTYRQWLTGMALQGLITQSDSIRIAEGKEPKSFTDILGKAAWAYADAVLESEGNS